MTKTTIARFAGVAAGAGLALGVFAPVGAQTIAQLQAQIAALMAQLQQLQGGSASAAITSDLTVGSTGSQVVALQNALVAQGYLTMPAGVAPGYFGALTKAAVMKWQAANGISATGYFGPLSRAAFGTTAGGTTTGGTTVGGTTGTSAGITTPGAEGTLAVTNAPVSNSTVYVGQSMRDILAFKAEAKQSDIAIQRVKVDLGAASTFYRNVASKIYLVDDAGKTLASSDLNNSTVIKDGNYFVTLAGFSSVVAKGSSRVYTVKVDIQSSIESADRKAYTIQLANNGVRGIDGAGIDLYSPVTGSTVNKSITVAASLVDSATLTVSSNASNPLTREVVAALGADENEADKVVLMVFDIKADKDDIKITDMKAFTTTATGVASASTTYLYVGNGTGGQLLGTDAVATTVSDFENISYTIPAGATRTFTLAADIRGAAATVTTFATTWVPNLTNIVAENTAGDAPSAVSGSASANDLLVRNVGLEISLASKTLTPNAGTSALANGTSTATATFDITLKAVGGPIWFGTQSASTTFGFGIHKNGADAALVLAASSTSWAIPSGVNTTDTAGAQSFKLDEGKTVTIPVNFVFNGRLTSGAHIGTTDAWAVGLSSVAWSDTKLGTAESSTYMSNKTEWRTNAVTLP